MTWRLKFFLTANLYLILATSKRKVQVTNHLTKITTYKFLTHKSPNNLYNQAGGNAKVKEEGPTVLVGF